MGMDDGRVDVIASCRMMLDWLEEIKKAGGMTVRESGFLESIQRQIVQFIDETDSNRLHEDREE